MFKKHPVRLLLALATLLLMLIGGLWALSQLPAGTEVPIHFDATGQANGWADARWGLFLLPLLALCSLGLFALLPVIDPRADKLRQSQSAQLNIALAVLLLLATGQALIISVSLGHRPDIIRWMTLMVGMLFAVIGNMLGKLRWNYTIGIRTPWTLANERVWDKTHRFGGIVFFIAGLVLITAALLAVPGSLGLPLILSAALTCTTLCVARSWLLWREALRHD